MYADNSEIDAGSIVQLKTGGPEMTVLSRKDNKLKCAWFIRKEECREHEFTPASVRLVRADEAETPYETETTAEIHAGDTVQLKTTSPRMTVLSNVDNKLNCAWFIREEECRQHQFTPESLRRPFTSAELGGQ